VREAVFSSLTSMDALAGSRVLDLFAGTGAMGIEALSRGAATATFVDADPAAAHTVRDNLDGTGLAGGTVVRADALRWLAGTDARFDLALVDPPYSFGDWPSLLARLPASLAVLETGHPLELAPPWVVIRSARYGGTVVTTARRG
jgi:16S rRNA (guanine966-N2)-methyltransferase